MPICETCNVDHEEEEREGLKRFTTVTEDTAEHKVTMDKAYDTINTIDNATARVSVAIALLHLEMLNADMEPEEVIDILASVLTRGPQRANREMLLAASSPHRGRA